MAHSRSAFLSSKLWLNRSSCKEPVITYKGGGYGYYFSTCLKGGSRQIMHCTSFSVPLKGWAAPNIFPVTRSWATKNPSLKNNFSYPPPPPQYLNDPSLNTGLAFQVCLKLSFTVCSELSDAFYGFIFFSGAQNIKVFHILYSVTDLAWE